MKNEMYDTCLLLVKLFCYVVLGVQCWEDFREAASKNSGHFWFRSCMRLICDDFPLLSLFLKSTS